MAGLIVSFALENMGTLSWMVIMTFALETSSVNLERLVEYFSLNQEKDWEIVEEPHFSTQTRGQITFQDYSLCYRSNLKPSLQNLSLHIKAGEHIGVCGRTGAGKSSFVKALFRIVEAAEGHIFIDGVNIKTLGLKTLRSSITIVPQETAVLDGSIKDNMDPLGQATDENLWSALEKVGLAAKVRSLKGGLEGQVGEGGSFLSAGQCQLLCLARILLLSQKVRVVVLDEATSSIDYETDGIIQKVIRDSFANCTIVSVAHRLETLVDCDKILVMKKGKMVEFDTSMNLLINPQSEFRGMAEAAGVVDKFKANNDSINTSFS